MFTKLVLSFQRKFVSKQRFHNHRFSSTSSEFNLKHEFAWIKKGALLGAGVFIAQTFAHSDDDPDRNKSTHVANGTGDESLPIEIAKITRAPNVPPPITRNHSARVIASIETSVKVLPIDELNTYEFWTFNGNVPGPFIRARVGDVLEVHHTNNDQSGMQHNIDFHCVSGPGGGAPLLTANKGKTKTACFKLKYPGFYFYHCAVDPVHVHVANGMYGVILVEPEEGLPPAKEFYVMQSEIYAQEEENTRQMSMSYEDLLNERPKYVVLNGTARSMVEKPIEATTAERVRIYFGNAGPNLVSSFHVIGAVFDRVYREGDLTTPPARGVHVTTVPSGGTTVVDMQLIVPGTYTILDHSLSRTEKGCVGFINVTGEKKPGVYHSEEPPEPCPGCSLIGAHYSNTIS